MAKKKLINYTNRDFNSIKADLEAQAKRFYPDSYRDFSENSFGSYLMDAVSYVGDMLSFYLDYQVNESFLQNAIEYDNVLKLASNQGVNTQIIPPVTALTSFYVIVPANTSGLGPNSRYIPTLKKGASVSANAGTSFVLAEDLDFNNPNNEVVAARFDDSTGKPTHYAIRAKGIVVSYTSETKTVDVGSFEKFLKVRVGDPGIFSVNSVVDAEGNTYYEVGHLAQDVIYVDTTNSNARADGVPSVIKRKLVPRRFTTFRDSSGLYLQFGSGEEETISPLDITEPSQISLQMTGRPYISDTAFDPSELLGTKTLGVAPSNTTLNISYNISTSDSINVSVGRLSKMGNYNMVFPNRDSLSSSALERSVISSLETANDTAISGDFSQPTSQEIKMKALSSKFTQMRAVTREDYEALVYLMPSKFGSVKRASMVNDQSSTNRRMTLYVVSSDSNGNLLITNDTTKRNVKTWLQTYKTLNDNVDIVDARIINIGFDFKILTDPTKNKVEVLNSVVSKIRTMMQEKMHIGEPFYLTKVFNIINKVDGVLDTVEVIPKLMFGSNYNTAPVSIEEMKSSDGTYLKAPRNVVFEIKNFTTDIKGTAV
jgi:hypothetical protein